MESLNPLLKAVEAEYEQKNPTNGIGDDEGETNNHEENGEGTSVATAAKDQDESAANGGDETNTSMDIDKEEDGDDQTGSEQKAKVEEAEENSDNDNKNTNTDYTKATDKKDEGTTTTTKNDVVTTITTTTTIIPEDSAVDDASMGESKSKVQNIKQSNASKSQVKHRKRSKRRPRHSKIFQDAITVLIPLDVTADLKLAIHRTKAKRIQSIYKRFPTLAKESQKKDDHTPLLDEEEDETNNNNKNSNKDNEPEKRPKPKKKKSAEHIPQPHQYGSVLDYLEAKYVKGVMLDDEDDETATMDDKSEGQGSVYSGGSFLDDTDLQRDVAEQVMANTTMTKLELEEDDTDFFVNVGNLEVEDNEYGDQYDPLQDKDNPTTKKRKKSQSNLTSTNSSGSTLKRSKLSADGNDNKTKKSSILSHPKTKKTTAAAPVSSSPSQLEEKGKETEEEAVPSDAERKRLFKIAKKAKTHSNLLYRQVVAMIKQMSEEELPRRRTKLKVALTCPANKKPGDDITFTNPHNPGQRLRVKVPKDCFPGGTFKVTVPVKQPPRDADKDGTDHNKFSRMFQELLDDFARAYDDWCQAQADADKKFPVYKEKQQKFDQLIKEFPPGLVTPVDANYLKKIVRRARQNKHKRSKTAAAKQSKEGRGSSKDDGGTDQEQDQDDVQEDEPSDPNVRKINFPSKGKVFRKMDWDIQDFAMDNNSVAPGSVTSDKPSAPTSSVEPKASTKAKKQQSAASEEPSGRPPKAGRTIDIPQMGKLFETRKWKVADFA